MSKFVSGDDDVVGRIPKVLTPVTVYSRVSSLLVSTD